MATVAEQLRTAREEKNLTIYQIAEITKIRTDHIRALEEGNYDVFSAPVYIRGFVRNCAGVLKLDVPGIMAALDGELAKTKNFRDPPPLMDQQRGMLDWLMFQLSRVQWPTALPVTLIVLALVVTGLVYRNREKHRKSNPLERLGPGLFQPARPSPGEMLPLPTNPPPKRP